MIGVFKLSGYVWILNLLLLGSFSYMLAQIAGEEIGSWFAPPSETEFPSELSEPTGLQAREPDNLDAYEVIVKRNIFNPEASGAKSNSFKSGSNEIPKTMLSIHLVATILGGDEPARAVIKNLEDGEVETYREGEEIDIVKSNEVRLARVDKCKIVTERTGRYETLECGDGVPSPSSPSQVTHKMASRPEVSTKGVPDYSADKIIQQCVYAF